MNNCDAFHDYDIVEVEATNITREMMNGIQSINLLKVGLHSSLDKVLCNWSWASHCPSLSLLGNVLHSCPYAVKQISYLPSSVRSGTTFSIVHSL